MTQASTPAPVVPVSGGRRAARDAADPVVGAGHDGQEASDPALQAAQATHAYAPAHVVDWDSSIDFDLKAYVRSVPKLRLDAAAVRALSEPRLSDAALTAITHFEIASADVPRVQRDLLVTPLQREARVTEFVVSWVFEEHWTTRAFRQVLTANAVPDGAGHATGRAAALRRDIDDRVRPLTLTLSSHLVGEDATAIGVTDALLSSAVLGLAAERLPALDARPELADLAAKVRARKDLHAQFFLAEVRARLERSLGGRRLVRAWLAAGGWRWPGSRYADRSHTTATLRSLLGSPSVRHDVDRIDAGIAGLPGLGGVTPVADALRRHGLGRSFR